MPALQCPVCRAWNEAGPACRRCRADLAPLFALEEERRQALDGAARLLAGGEWERALAAAERADAIRRGEDARRLLAVLHLLRRDFARAWQAYRAVGETASGA